MRYGLLATAGSIALAGCGRVSFTPLDDGAVAVARCGAEGSLVACFEFDGDTLDSSGHGHHAVGAVTFAPAPAGSAARFDMGVDLRVADSPGLDFGDALTVMATLRLDAFATSGRSVIIDRQDGFALYVNSDGRVGAALNTVSGATVTLASVATVSLDVWHHAAVTFDGAMMRLFIDGVQEAERSTTERIASDDPTGTRIGGDLPVGDEVLGDIDQLGIWNEGLPAARIACAAAGTC